MSNRPVIFLGTNSALEIFSDTCAEIGLSVHGIIDSDYYGNTTELYNIPVIDTENSLLDPDKREYYQQFDFFCATNWMPMTDSVTVRNRTKRARLLDLIEQQDLNCVNIIDPRAKISPSVKLGRGCYVGEFTSIQPGVVVEDFVNIYSHCIVGHGSRVGKNSVVQRRSSIIAEVDIGQDVYISMSTCLFKSGTQISDGTFVHECVYLKRSTLPGEIISLAGTNTRRVKGLNPIDN